MNSEPKSFASLSSGLLARKGAARPAMRPQGFGQVGANGLDDLGWNDMGFEAPKPVIAPIRDADHDAFGDEVPAPSLRNPLAALTPIGSPVHDQQAELADRFGASDEDGIDDGEDYVDDTAEPFDPDSADEASFASLSPASPIITPSVMAPQPAAEPRRIAPPSARRSRPRTATGAKGKAAFTLRLDNDRHLKLRLACALDGRSAQQIVTEALDQLLKSMPELDRMAEKAPKKSAA